METEEKGGEGVVSVITRYIGNIVGAREIADIFPRPEFTRRSINYAAVVRRADRAMPTRAASLISQGRYSGRYSTRTREMLGTASPRRFSLSVAVLGPRACARDAVGGKGVGISRPFFTKNC